MTVGFIGLGNLGTPLAANLLEKGHALLVYNRTASKAQPLIEKGATVCVSVKELAAACNVVFSIVADDAALNAITEGTDGLAANLKEGGVHISMSTILPETATRLHALHASHNNTYIASPVMGRPEAAQARKMNFLVSGDNAAIQKVKQLMSDAGAAGVWEFGDAPSAANVAKLCSNFAIISAIETMAEGVKLAKQSGIDAEKWLQMLTQTSFTSPVYVNYGNTLLKEAYLPAGFTLKLGLKDVNLINQQANAAGINMDFAKLLKNKLERGISEGLGDHDWTAIAIVKD